MEEQFYIPWPLIVWVLYRYPMSFVKVAAFIFAASFGYSLYATFNAPTEAYFSPVTRFWELMAGGMSAHLYRSHAELLLRHRTTLAWSGLTLVLVAVVFVTEQAPFPGWWALAPVLGTCALLLAGARAWVNRKLLGHPLAVRIGLVSYPFYLWHWPLLSFGYIVYGETPPAAIKAALVGSALILAVLTYRLCELPLKRLVQHRMPVSLLCAGMAVLCTAGLLLAYGKITPRVSSNGAHHILDALNDVNFPTSAMTPYPFRGVTFQQVRGNGRGTTVIMGDSVMAQYGTYVSNAMRMYPHQRRAVIFATAGGCPPISGAARLPRMKFPTCSTGLPSGCAIKKPLAD